MLFAHATIKYRMQNQSVQNSVSGNGLQGSAGLQPQDSSTQKQSATQPQQDVLGVNDYRTFDGKVQGPPAVFTPSTNSSGYNGFFIITVLVLLAAAAYAFFMYKKSSSTAKVAPTADLTAEVLDEVNVQAKPVITTLKKSKKSKPTKPKLKKKTSGSKNRKKR